MHSLFLPRPTPLPSTPFGPSPDQDNGLAKLFQKFSPTRSEQHGYPSPPMSEPHSPTRRSAQPVESERTQYAAPATAPPAGEAVGSLPTPSSAHFDTRPPAPFQSNPQQRPLYSGEPLPRHQPYHYQAGRSMDHASYGSGTVPQSYAYAYPSPSTPSYLGAGPHTGLQAQPGTMIAPPPGRPTKPARRTKAHVASACVNCKKAHLSCDVQRPCGRCVASGKQETCKDVQHKKRGRPRLRDDRDFTRPEEGRQPPNLTANVPTVSAPDAFPRQEPYATSHFHPSTESSYAQGRIAQRTDSVAGVHPLALSSSTRDRFGSMSSHAGPLPSPYAVGPNPGHQALPVAFLTLDLVIQKSNQAFQDLVAYLGKVEGKHLGEVLEPRQNESLQRLRNELRDERDDREPAYMAPITPVGHDPMRVAMESVVDRDVDRISQGFTDRPMFLNFRLPNDQYQSLQAQVRLAKTSLYFVTLVVHTPPRPFSLPHPAQQAAPPAPAHPPQPMSAPTPLPARNYTPQQIRPPSSASSAPTSPYFHFSSVRTSLPNFSPSSYASSPTYAYSPTTGPESSYFTTFRPPSQSTAQLSPYSTMPRTGSVASDLLRETNRPTRLDGLHLPPIRTAPAPLGSPLHLTSSQSASSQGAMEREQDRVRRRDSTSSADKRPETAGSGKRRRLNIHEVLE